MTTPACCNAHMSCDLCEYSHCGDPNDLTACISACLGHVLAAHPDAIKCPGMRVKGAIDVKDVRLVKEPPNVH